MLTLTSVCGVPIFGTPKVLGKPIAKIMYLACHLASQLPNLKNRCANNIPWQQWQAKEVPKISILIRLYVTVCHDCHKYDSLIVSIINYFLDHRSNKPVIMIEMSQSTIASSEIDPALFVKYDPKIHSRFEKAWYDFYIGPEKVTNKSKRHTAKCSYT